MILASYLVLLVVVLLVAGQTLAVAAFVRELLRAQRPASADCSDTAIETGCATGMPKAAVILSLRGPDPYLSRTLRALQQLDYPDYEIHLVVDSKSDPVWDNILDALDDMDALNRCGADRVCIRTLRNPASTCSLKCSSLVQAVRALNDSIEVVAFVDGDAVPHRLWLQDLVAPLNDSSIGVVTGNRWFVPKNVHWGTLVRYFWNVGAVVQVWLNGIVWAGSMAMRRDVIDKIELLEAWSKSLSVDATICRQLRKHRLRVRFAPNVMMANRENIGLSKFVGWVQRQLVAAKSCGPNWRVVALHALALTGSQLAALVICLAACLNGSHTACRVSLLAMAVYWVSATLSTVATEFSVRRVLSQNKDHVSWPRRAWLAFAPALALTHLAYPYALLGAYAQKQVSWRGVDYVVRGVNDIELCRYEPYQNAKDHVESVV